MSENESNRLSEFLQGKAFKMMLALVAIIVVSSGVLELAYFGTLATVERNQLITIQKSVLGVLDFDTDEDGLDDRFQELIETREFLQADGRTLRVWIGRQNDQTTGYAVRLTGGGFQGIIDIVVGFTPDLNQTTGFEVIQSGETPGLGDEMRTCKPEYCFKEEFEGMSTEPQVEFIKYRDPEKPNQFRAITGATFTTTAIRDWINKALKQLRALKESGEL